MIREQVFEEQQKYQDELRDQKVLKAQNETLKSRQYNYFLIGILVLGSVVLLFIWFLYSQKKTGEKKLLALNKEIAEQNEEITYVNKNLDRLVKNRTAIIEHQKQQVERFAYMNAHEIRGPLSTLIGLIHIIEDENLLKQNREVEDHLKKTTSKMQSIVAKVQLELNNEAWKKIEIHPEE
jgi:signal transduction histidine kinase